MGSVDQVRDLAVQVLQAIEALQRGVQHAGLQTYVDAFTNEKVAQAFGRIDELVQIPAGQMDETMSHFLAMGERLYREDTIFWLRGLEMLISRAQGFRLSGMLLPSELRGTADQLLELANESRDRTRSVARIEEIKVEAFECWERLKPHLLNSKVKTTTKEYTK